MTLFHMGQKIRVSHPIYLPAHTESIDPDVAVFMFFPE